ncbi:MULTISPECIES: zinc finger domain-containing protein [unclassified Arthrobacter]|uniref:Fpg/Nei family DNA glycosylase n=1 Tax=unclassified Arthrobacter TaxID=235627 RepID=UPI001E499016|nr:MULTISPECIES: zinc finger domain-containing protein [unclassified Arthrobacter]MCC9145658.1 Fpg/Nei family DNA glycosylase [Arthrobacter sp. zg-Y919]MDK1276887.1 zinc finger domain-containing protein [Arthrobacter sp. zg.Y919]WIB04180.1 zinc finger domain-containing protein [Arthrobacter sp. zg-Y919]
MPEGHSIHRLARQFSSVFGGSRLAVSSPQGRFAAGAAQLDGHVLEGASATGKQLFLHFDNDLYLRIHLGLYGAFDFGGDETFAGASSIGAPRRVGERETAGDDGAGYAGPPEPKGAVRVRLVSDHGWADLRGPTACEVVTEAERSKVLARLGPDPLADGADGTAGAERAAEFTRRLCSKGSPIGLLLMNQEVLAGVGNVYRAEVLFRAGISPWRLGRSVNGDEARELWNDVVRLMNDGVRQGRIITTLPGDREDAGEPVPVSEAHYVYQRTGLPCRRCGTPVSGTEMGARKLYWCPSCQAD